MVRLLILILCCFPTPLFGQAVYKGQMYNAPVCNNPNCAMCNYIRAQLATIPLPSSAYNSLPLTTRTYDVATQSSVAIKYETVQVPVVTRVKRCNGVTCWYENVTTYRTERRPIRNAVKAVRDVVDKATPNVDLLRVTELAPTPREAVTAMVALANVQPNEILYDLGCGDGRILVEATYLYGCRSVGVELNPDTLKLAAENVDDYGLANKIRLYQGDVLKYTYDKADVVTVYLYPELIEKILPRLPKGTRVISYLHSFTGSKRVDFKGYAFYTRTL